MKMGPMVRGATAVAGPSRLTCLGPAPKVSFSAPQRPGNGLQSFSRARPHLIAAAAAPSIFGPSSSRNFSSTRLSAFRSSPAAPAWYSFGRGKPKEEATSLASDASSEAQRSAEEATSAASSAAESAQAAASDAAATVQSQASEAASAIGNLADSSAAQLGVALSDMDPPTWVNVRWAVDGLNWIHDTTGLPWWVVIIGTTVAVRFALLPFGIKVQRNNARMNLIKPKIDAEKQKLDAAKSNKDMATLQACVHNMRTLFERNNCDPKLSLWGSLIQAPVFITFFFALKHLGSGKLSSMMVEGPPGVPIWSDLTAADPYMVAPLLSGLGQLYAIEKGTESGGESVFGEYESMLKWPARILMGGVVPYMMSAFPLAIFLFWIPNNLFGIIQAWILKNGTIRQKLDFPPLRKAPPKPVAPKIRGRAISFAEMARGLPSAGAAPKPKPEAPTSYYEEVDVQNSSQARAFKKWIAPAVEGSKKEGAKEEAKAEESKEESQKEDDGSLFESQSEAEAEPVVRSAKPVRKQAPARISGKKGAKGKKGSRR